MSDARVHGRPTFVVNNVVRPSTLPVGPLFYRFEVSTINFSPRFETHIVEAQARAAIAQSNARKAMIELQIKEIELMRAQAPAPDAVAAVALPPQG